jgi:hypothetical protein
MLTRFKVLHHSDSLRQFLSTPDNLPLIKSNSLLSSRTWYSFARQTTTAPALPSCFENSQLLRQEWSAGPWRQNLLVQALSTKTSPRS